MRTFPEIMFYKIKRFIYTAIVGKYKRKDER